MQQPKVEVGPSLSLVCVCRVISRSVVKELSGDPLQFLPRMHGASAAEGGEGNEYLEKFMAIRKDDLGLTPPRRASQDDVGSQEKALPVALYRDSTIGYWVPRIVVLYLLRVLAPVIDVLLGLEMGV